MILEMVPLELIDDSSILRREAHDNVDDLAKSISEIGLLQPITVKKLDNGKFRIILGARRYNAFKLLKKSHIPANISTTDNEAEIFLQQLAENMNREDFSPIEEAQLFQKLITDPSFHISIMYLSQKIGKSEKYIKRKLELMKFGENVQKIIHSGREILQNKLNEEQAISLKNVDFIFKDQLALKVASDAVPIQDVKKAASVFSSNELSEESKFTLLKLPFHDIVETCSIMEQKELEMQKFSEKPKLADTTDLSMHVVKQETQIISPTSFTDIEYVLKNLISIIPSHRPVSTETIYSYESIPIERRQDFLKLVDGLVDNLQAHLIDWRKIRDIVKNPIRLVNTTKK